MVPWGHVIAQAVSRLLPTTATQVRAQVNSRGIYGVQCGTGAGFPRILRFPLPTLIWPTAPHTSSIIRGWYNRPINGRRTKLTQFHPTPRNLKKSKKRTVGSFAGVKAVGMWSWPLTPIKCRGQEWWNYTFKRFMTSCLITYAQVKLYLFIFTRYYSSTSCPCDLQSCTRIRIDSQNSSCWSFNYQYCINIRKRPQNSTSIVVPVVYSTVSTFVQGLENRRKSIHIIYSVAYERNIADWRIWWTQICVCPRSLSSSGSKRQDEELVYSFHNNSGLKYVCLHSMLPCGRFAGYT
jgi:hypothetical protein